MELTTEIDYPGASVDAVMQMLLSEEFRNEVCVATGALSHRVDVEVGPDGSAVATVTRTMPAVVPDLVKRLVGETITVRQTERWAPPGTDETRTADVDLRIEGQPARLVGTLVVTQRSGGVHELLRGDLSVSIPFIGRRVEPDIAKAIRLGLRREQETGLRWLG